ncbi:MAG: hypothetical protein J6A96_05990 [Clostridia bacterium]|nr:hypothetical protein [Clostridia bacterium]
MERKFTVKTLTAKRRELWEKHHSISLDSELVEAIADKILDNENLRNEIMNNPPLLIESCFTIVDKKKRSVPFFFNEVQRDFIGKIHTQGWQKPYFILKGRQQGFTTLISALMLSFAIVKRNFSGFTLADRDDNTKAIFIDKAKFMYSSLPERLKPTEKFNSVNELFFDKLNSSWRIASATSNVGRSRTLSFIHYSEVAFFKCPLADLQKSISEAATEEALCIYETTANGYNDAKALWDSGSCYNLFYEWWRTSEYTSQEYEYLNTSDSWLKNRLKSLELRGLSKEQLSWYAKKYHSYIDKSSIKQEYPCSAEEAFLTSGECMFDKEKISNYLSSFSVKSKRGYFKYKLVPKPIFSPSGGLSAYETTIEDITFVEADDGYISIVEEPYSVQVGAVSKNKPYVIGADTAGSGEDFFSAKVIDNTCSRCVATLHIKNIDEDLFAHQLYCLGKYYLDALIGVETNFSTHPVRVLKALKYKNLYVSKAIGTYQDKPERNYGFMTTAVSRPIIVSNLVAVMRENIYLETDRETLFEMSTFIKGRNMRGEGASGTHDDLVMASAIAHFIGIDYTHSFIIIDKSNDFIKSNFSSLPLQEENYLEW